MENRKNWAVLSDYCKLDSEGIAQTARITIELEEIIIVLRKRSIMSEPSKVYFTNLRTKPGNNLLDKLEKLIRKAGVETIDFKEQFVAIKIHFGEPGNLALCARIMRHGWSSWCVNRAGIAISDGC